jgi:short-subunit dehydrogenase
MNFIDPSNATTETRQFAVVTGASSGIGLSLAKVLAEAGYDLLIVAEDAQIETVVPQLEQHGVQVRTLQADLATRQGNDLLDRTIRESRRVPDIVAINAGIGVDGDFARETDLEDEVKMIELNVLGTVHLAKCVLAPMIDRGSGRVLFTSSVASQMPASYMAVYGATKAFIQNFAQAVRDEIKDTGVSITTVLPGPTDTEFFERADMLDTKVGAGDKDDPDDVARDAYDALMQGKHSVVAGSFGNRAQVAMSHVTPEPVAAARHAKMAKPGSASGSEDPED